MEWYLKMSLENLKYSKTIGGGIIKYDGIFKMANNNYNIFI